MRLEELDFDLPPDLIATRPVEPREHARLMVVRRGDPGAPPEHRRVADLPDLLAPGDLMVFNRTRVVPARFLGRVAETGGRAEGLWLGDAAPDGSRWRVLIKARRFRPGRTIELVDEAGEQTGVWLELIERGGDQGEAGAWVVAVHGGGGAPTEAVLERVGLTPLPPYIRQARRRAGERVPDADDRAGYQTVFAEEAGSVAAPTAGLHFTEPLLTALDARGVLRRGVTLHVGAGTFKPVEADRVEDHPMHAEWCSIEPAVHADVFSADRRRLVAVGSTSARTVEAYAAALAAGERPGRLRTDLLITPGYAWRRVDAMLTNFHLPRSTLLAMVSAFVAGGSERVRSLYAEAVAQRYRFFSYGDAMLLLP